MEYQVVAMKKLRYQMVVMEMVVQLVVMEMVGFQVVAQAIPTTKHIERL